MLELFRSEDGVLDGTFVRLLDEPGSGAAVAFLGLLVAVGVGAVHALGPGHGKALIGAYLAGTRGRAGDAVALGVLVAAMHTGSVLAFGFALHRTQQLPGDGVAGAALSLATGGAIAAVGAWMVRRHLRSRRHAEHHHALPEGVAPLSRAGVFALASSGGLLPSPAAFLVLVAALAAGRAGYGVALVGAFSIGLAATLTGVGLTVLWGRERLVRSASRRPAVGWLTRTLPLAASFAVLAGGLLLSGAALSGW